MSCASFGRGIFFPFAPTPKPVSVSGSRRHFSMRTYALKSAFNTLRPGKERCQTERKLSNTGNFITQRMKPGQRTTKTVHHELEKISFIVWQELWNGSDYETQDSKNLMKMRYFFSLTRLSLLLISTQN